MIGVDIAENMVRFARQAIGDDSRIELHVTTGADVVMVPDCSVDFAYANDVFIHVSDVEVVRRYLLEIQRVLKPSALFRFIVRGLEPGRMFSNSLGGIAAKVGYKVGLLSPLGRYQPGAAGFNGIHYRVKNCTNWYARPGCA